MICPPWVTTTQVTGQNMWWGYCELRNGKVGVSLCFCGRLYSNSPRTVWWDSPWYLHILHIGHIKKRLWARIRLDSPLAQIWVFVSGHKGLAPGLSSVKGGLSPKLCDFCVTLIQWLVLLWHSGRLSRPKWHGKMISPLKSLQNVNAWNAKYDNNVNAQVSVQFNLLRTSQLCRQQT